MNEQKVANPILRAFCRLSLRGQLTILVGATVLPLLVSMLLMFVELKANERDTVRASLSAATNLIAALVDNEIDTHIFVGVALAQSPELQSGDIAAFYDQARRAIAFIPGAWLTLANADGEELFNTLKPFGSPMPRRENLELSKRAFETRRPQVSDLIVGQISHQLIAYVEVPVFKDDQPLYTISVTLVPARFQALVENRFVHGEQVGVLDHNQRYIARLPFAEERLGTLPSNGWREAIAKAPEGWVENVSLNGQRVVYGYTTSARGWVVGVSQYVETIDSPLRKILLVTGIAAFTLTLFSLGVATLIARLASKGVGDLRTAALALGQRKDISLALSPFAEANTIVLALKDALAELRRHDEIAARINDELETRVAERTTSLEAEMKRREASEERIRQMEKMDAIGQLSGGIAHDFNNVLAIILGSVRLLKRKMTRGETDVGQYIDAIVEAANRAVALTQRLLTFARRHPTAPKVFDPNKVLASLSDLLHRTIPENISVEMVLAAGVWQVQADVNQLENAILNIASNARDAMPSGGRLTIETTNAYLDDTYVETVGDVAAGQYVLIAITDTGMGMAPDVIDKAFEPFFTTKPEGQGTGLGLAQVFGFIKQLGGHVKLYNEPGHGLTVKLYLPRFVGKPPAAVTEVVINGDAPRARSNELILVVEDDPAVMKLTAGMLNELGYQTACAINGDEALAVLAKEPSIRLIVTDVVMPKMNGRTLADAALKARPDLKVLFVTGYTRNAIVHNNVVDSNVEMLSKPFTLEALARRVYLILGECS